MILQELCNYYNILDADEGIDIPSKGYSNTKVAYALVLSEEGTLLNIINLKEKPEKGNKLVSKIINTPFQKKRSSGVFPYFLSDNSKYVLGLSKDKKKPIEINEKNFDAFKELHLNILKDVDNAEKNAIINFLENWDFNKAEEILVSVDGYEEDILFNSNFIFQLDGQMQYIHQNKEIKKAWIKYQDKELTGELGQCLVTGEESTLALLHENIKGVKDAQPAGATIVGFNQDSFISYEKKQSYNAPVSIDSAFKYTTVLNYMLQFNSKQKTQIGDATTVFWANTAKSEMTDLFEFMLNPSVKSDKKKTDEERIRDEDIEYKLKSVFKNIKKGNKISEINKALDDDAEFFVLGLSPNNARIAVRFFYRDTFGGFVKKINKHYKDLELEGSKFETVPVWMILKETTVSDKDKVKPLLAGRLMKSVLTGAKYPEDLYIAMIGRIRADRNINHNRVSVIKAYLIRKKIKEVLTVSLNENETNTAYRLGRLFAYLEKTQELAQGTDVNSGIKDKYFSSASATPCTVFPVLMNLLQHHLKKIKTSTKWLEIGIGDVIDGIDVFPKNQNMEDQGLFIIGYYHQRQAFFKKKEKPEEQALTNEEL